MSISCDAVAGIYNRFSFFDSNFVVRCTYNTKILKKDNDFSCRHDFVEVMDKSLSGILHVFDKASDIEGLDAAMNGDVDLRLRDYLHNIFYMPYCLIVARLARNPNFEELALSLRKCRLPGANADAMMTEWPKLVEYLRNEVKPIV